MRLVSLGPVEALRPLDMPPLILGDVDGHIRPPRLRNVRVASRRQQLRRVQVQNERAAGPLASPIDAHHPVDVLRRGAVSDKTGHAERVGQPRLEIALARETLVWPKTAEAGTLHQHGADRQRRVGQQALEQRRLAPVAADVCRVE